MSAIELFHQDGKPAGVWYCSECRAVRPSKDSAETCHRKLCDCGKPVSSRYVHTCQECDNREWRERMASAEFARYEKATKIPASEWTGDQVFVDDRYFDTVDEAVEHMEASGGSTPEYIWAAKDIGVCEAHIEDILERVTERMWEDAGADDLNGVPELEAAIDAFNKVNEDITVWMVDYSTAILVGPRCPTCGGTGVEKSGVCHCGESMDSKDSMFAHSGHTPVETERPCPDCSTQNKTREETR